MFCAVSRISSDNSFVWHGSFGTWLDIGVQFVLGSRVKFIWGVWISYLFSAWQTGMRTNQCRTAIFHFSLVSFHHRTAEHDHNGRGTKEIGTHIEKGGPPVNRTTRICCALFPVGFCSFLTVRPR